MKNPIKNALDNALERTEKVQSLRKQTTSLNAKVEQTERSLQFEKFRSARLEEDNRNLKEALALKEGRAIFDMAQQELAMGLTRELEEILRVMRERVSLQLFKEQRVDQPGMPHVLDFRLVIPEVQLRFTHRVSMRDAADYHMGRRVSGF